MSRPKNPLRSRTIWANLVALATAIVMYLAESPLIIGTDADGWVPSTAVTLVTVAGILNIVFRFLTSEPVKSPRELLEGSDDG